MKKILTLLALLLIGSFLCFYPSKTRGFEDWVLFLIVFFVTFLGVFLFFQSTRTALKPRSLRRKKQREAIYDALPEGLLLLSHKGRILYSNKKATHLIHLEQEKLLGGFLSDLKKHSSLLEHCDRLLKRCASTGLQQTLSFCLDGPDQKSCDIVVKPLPESSHFLLLMQDSSGQYQKHQLGKDFVANASHELRTPITIIKGFAETLSELPEVSEVMFQDFTEKIIRNCQRMDLLVKNLLTLTDLDYLPQARVQECDLVALVDNCIYTLLAVHPDINIQALQNQEVVSISADPDLLELALMNLLENGVKYSKPPADLTITIEDRSEEVFLTIADKGMGIPAEDVAHIFERFYTVDKAHSRRLGGAGLGLSIVKTIIEKHEGNIEVQSTLGKGTAFTLTFRKAFQPLMHYPLLGSSQS